MREKAVQLLKEMVETPSVTGSEVAVAKLIQRHMNELGYSTLIDETGNIIGRIGEGSPNVLLCGHMDTVSGILPVKYENGVITGRGSVDAKGPLSALIVGGALALESGFTGSITVAGVVDEEGRNKGVLQLLKNGMNSDYAIFGEPTNVNTITIGYKGVVLIRIDVRTQPGHSSAPWLYTNAIEKSMELFWAIKTAAASLTEEKQGVNSLTTTIREICGGENAGVIPSSCKLFIEFRVPSSVSTSSLLERVNDTVGAFINSAKDMIVDMDLLERVEPFTADPKNYLVKAFTRSIYTQTGLKVALVKKSGTGDMNYFGSQTRVPCITYGPGDPHLDHTEQERINIEDYLRSIEVIRHALVSLSAVPVKTIEPLVAVPEIRNEAIREAQFPRS